MPEIKLRHADKFKGCEETLKQLFEPAHGEFYRKLIISIWPCAFMKSLISPHTFLHRLKLMMS